MIIGLAKMTLHRWLFCVALSFFAINLNIRLPDIPTDLLRLSKCTCTFMQVMVNTYTYIHTYNLDLGIPPFILVRAGGFKISYILNICDYLIG